MLPLIDELTASATSQMYRSEADAPMVFVGGTELVDVARTYMNGVFEDDPMQVAARRANPWIMRMSRYPEYERFVRSPAHAYFRGAGVPNLCHVRLIDAPHLAPGSVGFVLARSARQLDFDARDERALATVLPSLRAAARRCRRTLAAGRTRRTLEALLEAGETPPAAGNRSRGQAAVGVSTGRAPAARGEGARVARTRCP